MSEKEKEYRYNREEIEKAEAAYFKELLKSVSLRLFILQISSQYIIVPKKELRKILVNKYGYSYDVFEKRLELVKKYSYDITLEECVLIKKEVFLEDE